MGRDGIIMPLSLSVSTVPLHLVCYPCSSSLSVPSVRHPGLHAVNHATDWEGQLTTVCHGSGILRGSVFKRHQNACCCPKPKYREGGGGRGYNSLFACCQGHKLPVTLFVHAKQFLSCLPNCLGDRDRKVKGRTMAHRWYVGEIKLPTARRDRGEMCVCVRGKNHHLLVRQREGEEGWGRAGNSNKTPGLSHLVLGRHA